LTSAVLSDRAARNAVSGGIEFLARRQSETGSWTDWDLPPGPSSSWTTAYVGCQLGALARDAQRPALRRAACWLADRERPDGGWGYAAGVGCDADSTAHAILFLSLVRAEVGVATYDRLESFQQPDGGFSTYAADDGLGSWGLSHLDVTAIAARALMRDGRSRAVAVGRALDYVCDQRDEAGLWNSFWWSTPLYATAACLSLLAAAGVGLDPTPTRESLRGLEAASAFERALLVDCLRLAGDTCDPSRALVEALASEQLADGSWASVPVLRITDRGCSTPWSAPSPGLLYADPDRVFTSATVVAALARAARDR
jgi:hypothetical protein